ncbi:hypothetical protein BH20ACT2_BH20ACT2_01980 [soil metagenome]
MAALASGAAPARLCVVVKADGYGHGALPVGRAALDAGADWLAVALVEEGVALRRAGIEAPVLLLSEPCAGGAAEAVAQQLRPTVYTAAGIEALAAAADDGAEEPLPVHLKIDTGMHRVGALPEQAGELVRLIQDRPSLVLEGLCTHCAVADEPGNPFTEGQLDRFDAVVDDLARAGVTAPLRHAANSAATIEHPRSRYDMVRCGISVYGLAPGPALVGRVDLHPALALRSRVTLVKQVLAGEALSYGLRHRFSRDSLVATVPIGYADGLPRRLGAVGGEVLVGGHRCPIAGTVTMDQITVDCTDVPGGVLAGDEVVLIGEQAGEVIGADDWAARLDTIGYEIICGVGPRVPRHHLGGSQR